MSSWTFSTCQATPFIVLCLHICMYMARYVKDTDGRNLAPPDMYETMYIMGYVPYQPVRDFFPSTVAFGGEKIVQVADTCRDVIVESWLWTIHGTGIFTYTFTTPKPTWKAKCPIFKAIVAGFRDKVASKHRTLGVPGTFLEVCMVNNLVFSWPKPLCYMV